MTATNGMPPHMDYFRLAQLKGMIKLEGAGMKTSESPIRPKIAAELGLKPTDAHSVFVAEIQGRMDVMVKEEAARKAQMIIDAVSE